MSICLLSELGFSRFQDCEFAFIYSVSKDGGFPFAKEHWHIKLLHPVHLVILKIMVQAKLHVYDNSAKSTQQPFYTFGSVYTPRLTFTMSPVFTRRVSSVFIAFGCP